MPPHVKLQYVMGSTKRRIRTSPARATALVTGLFGLGLTAGSLTGAAAVSRAQNPYQGLDLFARVLTTIEQDYVDHLDNTVLVDAAVRGMVEELDPHTRWLSAERVTKLYNETHGEYYGVGVKLVTTADGALVTHVIDGSPAHRDGMKPGDVIVAIDGESTKGQHVADVESRLQGERGANTSIDLLRHGEPTNVVTFRDVIRTQSVDSARLPGGIAYLRLTHFEDDAADELTSAYDLIDAQQPVTGLILDLRDNPGGLLDQAVSVADLFLDEGVIVSTQSRTDGERSFSATAGGLPENVEVVVLVNGMSASASEIVTSALQESKRAIIVGTRTYGKGSVQSLYRNPDGSALKLTTGRYYTRSGKPVAPREGRLPDVVIELDVEPSPKRRLIEKLQATPMDDANRVDLLELAEAQHDTPPNKPSVDWETPAAGRTTDVQLAKAVQLLSL
jgi:carboxyl-terminal processing protease